MWPAPCGVPACWSRTRLLKATVATELVLDKTIYQSGISYYWDFEVVVKAYISFTKFSAARLNRRSRSSISILVSSTPFTTWLTYEKPWSFRLNWSSLPRTSWILTLEKTYSELKLEDDDRAPDPHSNQTLAWRRWWGTSNWSERQSYLFFWRTVIGGSRGLY